MAAGSTHAALASIIREADPAAQISPQLVDCLAAELSPLFENLAAVYGRETDLKELLPSPTHCPACQNRLAECRSSAAAAIIVGLAGIVEKQHVPLRCRRPSCPGFGVLYWHNYRVPEGRHVFHGKLPGFRCFMPSSVFGFSVCRGFSSSMLAWSGSTIEG